jgi:hypothetical protein
MDKIQKKVLLFLLKELDEQVKEWSCDEMEVPDLAEDERRWLTQMMWGFWGEEEEWDGSTNKEFGIGALIDIARYWLTGKKS